MVSRRATPALASVLAAVVLFAAPAIRGEAPSRDAVDVDRAAVLAVEGQREEALALYDEVLVRTPEHREARRGRARVLGWQGRHDEALADLDALLADEPDDLASRLLRARVLGWSGRGAEAEAEVRRAIALAPDSVDAWVLLGTLLTWDQRSEEAGAAFEQALALDASSSEAREGLRRLAVGNLPGEASSHARLVRVDLGMRYDTLDGGRSDWWEEGAHGAVQLPRRVRLHLGAAQTRRFREDDTQGSVGLSWASGNGWWLGGSGFFAPGSTVVARQGFSLEVARRIAELTTLQLTYRRSWYPGGVETDAASAALDFWSTSLAKVIGRYHFTHLSGGRQGHAGSLRAELLPEGDFVPYVGGVFGDEAFAPSTVQGARTRARIASFTAGVVWKLRPGLGIRLGYAFEDLDDTYTRHGLESGLFAEF